MPSRAELASLLSGERPWLELELQRGLALLKGDRAAAAAASRATNATPGAREADAASASVPSHLSIDASLSKSGVSRQATSGVSLFAGGPVTVASEPISSANSSPSDPPSSAQLSLKLTAEPAACTEARLIVDAIVDQYLNYLMRRLQKACARLF